MTYTNDCLHSIRSVIGVLDLQKIENNIKKRASKVTIKIPRPLYEKISRVIEGAGYNSVTDFAVYVLRDLVVCHELAGRKTSSSKELKKVKQRLHALGYLQ